MLRDLAVGELTDRRRVVLPVLAGIGGMVVPVLLYLLIAPGGETTRGWGIVIGTDTAFLLGVLALVGPATLVPAEPGVRTIAHQIRLGHLM